VLLKLLENDTILIFLHFLHNKITFCHTFLTRSMLLGTLLDENKIVMSDEI